MTLYSMPSSGNSYKVRLLLAHLGLPYRHVPLEFESEALAEAHASGILPFGKLPVLELENGKKLAESNAILCYLADGTDWMPADPVTRAEALGWMFWEQNQHEGVIAVRAALQVYASRRHLATPERMASLLDRGHDILGQMDAYLSRRQWLAGDGPSVADISLYAYTHSAGTKGGFDLGRFGHVVAWVERVAALPGHIGLWDIPE
ncbi:glutathione S-transferase family protein [Alphaproteobacteria bacterium GH1-50]|uniref:Glutathione S-transferase family protein n=1 Tax=Kangsaoukella pontilimi TaxID=2691042 RepID=A0A7C9NET7_9RHOB|nr:glutathione S-transferase family protein [Kangsaoukella pontilimi]